MWGGRRGESFPRRAGRSERRRLARASASKSGHGSANKSHLFAIEELEPRLLLSGDLSPAAALVITQGLQALDTAANNLAETTALSSANLPFINRNLGQLAALGDPIAAVETAAANYINNNVNTNNNTSAATLDGLANALTNIPSATVMASANDAADTITVNYTSSTTAADSMIALSASGDGHTLSTSQSLTEATTKALNLTFGVDLANAAAPKFEILTAAVSSNTEFSGVAFAGNTTLDGATQSIVSGSVDIVADVSAQLDTTAEPLTTAGSVPAAFQTMVTGSAALNMIVASGTPAIEEAVSVTVPDIANPASQIFDPTQVQPSPLATQVNSVINDVSSELSTIEGQINSAAGFASDLPFIGQQLASDLNPAKLFQPINSELNALENTINTDLSNSATLLTTLESDIVSALSSVNLLPGTPGNDVTIDYVANGQQATVGPGTTGDLTNVTQLELDLILGQSVTDTYPVGTDIGLPGLGLKLQPGSTINGTIGWSFDLGLGLSQANGPYLVAGNASNNGSPVNFNVSFTLGNNFQAVGTMGFLEALLTEPNEPNPAAHTGVTGNIGVVLTGATGGTALNGGMQINPSDISKLSAGPNFSLTTKSALQLAFGAQFMQNQGVYTDVSKFPSLSATLQFDWTVNGSSLSSQAPPTVALDNINIDLGTAITDFLLPVIKPFYDATSGLTGLFNFLTSEMQVVGPLLQDNLIPDIVVNQILPTYTSGETYTWLDFAIDIMIDKGILNISAAEGRVIETVAADAMMILSQMDAIYSDGSAGAASQLMVPLGNFTFAGKNLKSASDQHYQRQPDCIARGPGRQLHRAWRW